MKNFTKIISALTIVGVSAGFTTAQADVKYRIAYDTAESEYALYMMPGSVPSPDFTVAAQITLKVPQSATNNFSVNNIQSNVTGAAWQMHSRIDQPVEAPDASYLSFGMTLSGGTAPVFNWEAGVEQKVFTFQSASGCVPGLSLISTADPFNQMPNSVNTNPGNNFTNLGWTSANNYMGNYGDVVTCGAGEPTAGSCPKAERKAARIDRTMHRIEAALARLEERKMRLKARLDELAAKKANVGQYCL